MERKHPTSTVWLTPAVLDKSYQITFRDDHIHVTLGRVEEITSEMQAEYWAALRKISEEHRCYRVLIEGERPRVEPNTHQIIEAGMRTGTVPDLWMAYCLQGFEKNDGTELYQAISSSQHVHIRFFTDRDNALAWLRNNAPR
jgi:hypothetical protein